MDAESGELLFEQNAKEASLIASLSKIMVAYRLIKAIESGHANRTWSDLYTMGPEVTFKSLGGTTINANSTVKGYSSKIEAGQKRKVTHYMQPGDKMSFSGLLYGAMTVSGNDAATAIAVALEGSEEAFVQRVNEQMHTAPFNLSDSTYFSRAYGRDCYASASDIAQMLKTILDDPDVAAKFWEFSSAEETDQKVTIIHEDGTAEEICRKNTHPFITGQYRERLTSEIGENYRICGKTGTWIVDFVLATIVEREGRTLISVVLGTKNAKERDDTTLELLSWGFNH